MNVKGFALHVGIAFAALVVHAGANVARAKVPALSRIVGVLEDACTEALAEVGAEKASAVQQ